MTTEPASPNGASHRRIAAIDVGTNSLRLIVAEALPDATYRVIDDEKAVTRLGRGLASTGRLDEMVMEESARAISRMKGIADGYGVCRLRIVGTCAVREAQNGADFRALVRERTGLEIEPISAEEEARLAHLSAANAFDLRATTAAVVDIGGGSTEIVLSAGGVVEQVYTLPLGAVRQTEQHPGVEAPGGDAQFETMRRGIRRDLKRAVGQPPIVPQFIIGTGGTFTTLAAISMHRATRARDSGMLPFAMRGHEINRSELRHTLDWIRQLPLKARLKIPGLSPDRAEIIIAGLVIAESVMRVLGVNTIRVHDRGIRDGLLLTMLDEMFPGAEGRRPEPVDRMRSVRQFALNCRYEELHSNHVATLALQVYDQMHRQCPRLLGPAATAQARELLHAAAVLHDVGYLINYAKHHKHSYHLIVHSDLSGFTHRELEIVANIARYHRRSDPKPRHLNFACLAAQDMAVVRALASVLRIADGLDRTHTQSVRAVHLHVSGREALFMLEAPEEPSVDIWGAERKSRMFEKTFGLSPRFEWISLAPAEAAPADPAALTLR